MSRRCPVSGATLQRDTIHGVEVDSSPAGLWLDKGELLLITEAQRHADASWTLADLFRREQRPRVDRTRALPCPVCRSTMQVVDLHGVGIDWCTEHGVWLDAGELDAIRNNLRLDRFFVDKIATRLWEARF
jgi:Zn-finger nucleic acid-binding protein